MFSFNIPASFLAYRFSSIKRPDFIVQDDFGDVLKIGKCFFLGVEGMSAKLMPTSEDRGCHVVSVTDSYRSRYFFFQIAPQ
jgi:hypothetical protein